MVSLFCLIAEWTILSSNIQCLHVSLLSSCLAFVLLIIISCTSRYPDYYHTSWNSVYLLLGLQSHLSPYITHVLFHSSCTPKYRKVIPPLFNKLPTNECWHWHCLSLPSHWLWLVWLLSYYSPLLIGTELREEACLLGSHGFENPLLAPRWPRSVVPL